MSEKELDDTLNEVIRSAKAHEPYECAIACGRIRDEFYKLKKDYDELYERWMRA